MARIGDRIRTSLLWRLAWTAVGLLAAAGLAQARDLSASVVRVRAVAGDGTVSVGSGVVTAPGRIATACHVTRGADAIEVEHGNRRIAVEGQVGSEYHDLCLLVAPLLDAPAVPMRDSSDVRPGEAVVAVGYPRGRDATQFAGDVAARYAHDAGYVIRTTAAFEPGTSGGGLFDEAGNLIGILAFKARRGTGLGFALPTEWLALTGTVGASFVPIAARTTGRAFWELSARDRPAFLGVAAREAAGPAP